MGRPLPVPCLCLVTDRTIGDPDTLVYRIAQAVAGGVDMVQLREKDLPGAKLLRLATKIKEASHGKALLIVNERIDVALAAEADGVQLGEEALPTAQVRNLVGDGALIGRSVHSAEGAMNAAEQGADFLVAGTMFTTRSHPGEKPVGPSLIKNIVNDRTRSSRSVPIIGIGGITSDNLAQVIRFGASGVAVISSILAAADPKGEAEKLKSAMLEAWQDRPSIIAEQAGGGPNRI